jgi:WD40 repeat protein
VTDDGSRALSASRDLTARIWDLQGQVEEHILLGHTSRVYGAAITGDGELAITGSEDQSARVWSVSDGRLIATFTSDGLLSTCAVAGERTFLVGDAMGRIHFLQLEVADHL